MLQTADSSLGKNLNLQDRVPDSRSSCILVRYGAFYYIQKAASCVWKGLSKLCLQSLHRNHAAASGALMTGDASSGYTLHLRPPDGSPHSSQALRSFMEIVNGSRVAAPTQQQPSSPQRAGTVKGGHEECVFCIATRLRGSVLRGL